MCVAQCAEIIIEEIIKFVHYLTNWFFMLFPFCHWLLGWPDVLFCEQMGIII